jgi:hypothetical protein
MMTTRIVSWKRKCRIASTRWRKRSIMSMKPTTEVCTKSVGRASNPWQEAVYQNIAVLINYYGN